MTTNLFGIMKNISSIAMEVCFGRGLVPAISAVMELASLAVAAGVCFGGDRKRAPAVIVGMESQDMATLMTEHLTNFLRISSLPSKCKLISRHGYRSLSWCMNGGEEECDCEQMTHPLSAVSGRGLLRRASIRTMLTSFGPVFGGIQFVDVHDSSLVLRSLGDAFSQV